MRELTQVILEVNGHLSEEASNWIFYSAQEETGFQVVWTSPIEKKICGFYSKRSQIKKFSQKIRRFDVTVRR
jgi:hypothetical protein